MQNSVEHFPRVYCRFYVFTCRTKQNNVLAEFSHNLKLELQKWHSMLIYTLWLHYSEVTLNCNDQTITMTTTALSPTLLCSFHSPLASKSSLYHLQWHIPKPVQNHNPFSSNNSLSSAKSLVFSNSRRTHLCYAGRRKPTDLATSSSENEGDENLRRVLQIGLWGAEVVYILWLFLLPYAPVGTPSLCSVSYFHLVIVIFSLCWNWMCFLELIIIQLMWFLVS